MDIKTSKAIVGYYCNTHYLSVLDKNMPDKETSSFEYNDHTSVIEIDKFVKHVTENKLYGFANITLELPKNIRNKYFERTIFEREFVHVLHNLQVKYFKFYTCKERVSERALTHINNCIIDNDDNLSRKINIYLPTLKYLLKCGLKITELYNVVYFSTDKPYKKLTKNINIAMQTKNTFKSLTEVFKNADNNITNTKYNEHDEIPIRCGMTIYPLMLPTYHISAIQQLIALRLIKFYNFITKYIDSNDFEIIKVKTYNIYMSLAAKTLDELIIKQLKPEFDLVKKKWFSDSESEYQSPGTFQLKFKGELAITLHDHHLYCVSDDETYDYDEERCKTLLWNGNTLIPYYHCEDNYEDENNYCIDDINTELI